jgi:hypothetical protein
MTPPGTTSTSELPSRICATPETEIDEGHIYPRRIPDYFEPYFVSVLDRICDEGPKSLTHLPDVAPLTRKRTRQLLSGDVYSRLPSYYYELFDGDLLPSYPGMLFTPYELDSDGDDFDYSKPKFQRLIRVDNEGNVDFY